MKFSTKYFFTIAIVLIVSILALDAITTMLFGSLGKTPESSDWNYILALYIFLASLGAISLVANLEKSKLKVFQILQAIAKILSVTLSCALIGFYYGGSLTNNNLQVAIFAALALAVLGTILSLRQNQMIFAAVNPVPIISAYGFAYYAGTKAIALFYGSRLLGGILWGLICLAYLGVTMVNITKIKFDRQTNKSCER